MSETKIWMDRYKPRFLCRMNGGRDSLGTRWVTGYGLGGRGVNHSTQGGISRRVNYGEPFGDRYRRFFGAPGCETGCEPSAKKETGGDGSPNPVKKERSECPDTRESVRVCESKEESKAEDSKWDKETMGELIDLTNDETEEDISDDEEYVMRALAKATALPEGQEELRRC